MTTHMHKSMFPYLSLYTFRLFHETQGGTGKAFEINDVYAQSTRKRGVGKESTFN